ncbi:MAG: SPOR domain-containing protein, partial [Thermoanaerobaculia bacterium]
ATPVPEAAFPAPLLGVATRGPSARLTAARPPGPTEAAPALQLFEDRPSSEPPKAAAAPKPPEPAGYWVQVDSLSSKEQAEARRRGLGSAGFTAAVFPGAGPKGAVYRVRVGPYGTRDDAERAALQLVLKARVSKPWVVPPGQ